MAEEQEVRASHEEVEGFVAKLRGFFLGPRLLHARRASENADSAKFAEFTFYDVG